ncbi:MAG: hypothetical protein QM811_02190 [Pirellulales bacterium]
MKCLTLRAVVGLSIVLVGWESCAAILQGSATAPSSYTVATDSNALIANLSSAGSVDWAYWSSALGASAPGTPTNSKLSATPIGSITSIGAGTLRGSSSTNVNGRFTYTDGTSPTASTAPGQAITGLFNETLNTNNVGVSLPISLPTTDTYLITLWVSGFNATGAMTASLTGATNYTDSSLAFQGTKNAGYYTFLAKADTAGDTLTLNYVTASNSNASSHVLIAAATVAIAPIPEPSTFAVLAFGAISCAAYGLRRFRA